MIGTSVGVVRLHSEAQKPLIEVTVVVCVIFLL